MSIKLPFMILWSLSCSECIPKGSLKNLYLPNGVFIVSNLALSPSKGICQYPFFGSNFVKWVVSAGLVEMYLNFGSWKWSIFLTLFKSYWSRQNCSETSGFSTTTSEFTHFLGSSTFSMTSAASIPFSSFFSLLLSDLPRSMENWIWISLQVHEIWWLQSSNASNHFRL